MSAIFFHSGCLSGDHRMTCGLRSIGAMTWTVGWSLEFWIASSVATTPSVRVGSRYIWAETCWNPIAGPPERTSSRTPVSRPDATSSAETRFCDRSTDGLSPRSRYSPACSACGYQFIWTTIVEGHTGWWSRLLWAAARGATTGVRAVLPPPPHATATAAAAAISSRDVAMPIEPSPPAHTFHRSHVNRMLARPGWRGRYSQEVPPPLRDAGASIVRPGRAGARGRAEALRRRHVGAGRRRPGRRGGRARRRRGAVRLRQEHAAAPGRGAGGAHLGDGARGGRPHRLGVPGRDAAAVAAGAGQRRAARRAGRGGGRRAPGARRPRARAGRTGRPRRQPAAHAVGRHADARVAGAGAHARSRAVPVRRAVRGAGRPHPAAARGRAAGAVRAPALRGAVRDALRAGGGVSGEPRGGAVAAAGAGAGGRGRAVRVPAGAGAAVRTGLHGEARRGGGVARCGSNSSDVPAGRRAAHLPREGGGTAEAARAAGGGARGRPGPVVRGQLPRPVAGAPVPAATAARGAD